jgi:hypothetical protein
VVSTDSLILPGGHTEAHTVASHSDTTATGAETETLTDGSNASALHVHTVVSLDTDTTGAELTSLADGSEVSIHTHAGGGNTVLTAVKGSDQARTSSTTLTDAADMTITLVADKTYAFTAATVYNAHSTPDIKFQWIEADGTFDFLYHSSAADDESVNEGSGAGGKTGNGFEIVAHWVGTITAGGSGGTFKLQFGQNTSNGNATTLKAGSWMRAEQLN